jgi:toxin ParE1/3/4
MMRPIWSLQSLDDLVAIRDYVSRDAPVAAQRLVESIYAKADPLAAHLRSGSLVEEDSQGIYRQLLYGNYRLIYRVDDAAKVVRIVTVIHAAQLLDPHKLN